MTNEPSTVPTDDDISACLPSDMAAFVIRQRARIDSLGRTFGSIGAQTSWLVIVEHLVKTSEKGDWLMLTETSTTDKIEKIRRDATIAGSVRGSNVLFLIHEIERLRAENERLRTLLDKWDIEYQGVAKAPFDRALADGPTVGEDVPYGPDSREP